MIWCHTSSFLDSLVHVVGIWTAVSAIEHGASAVIVSNHGGRQADYAPATIDVLAEV